MRFHFISVNISLLPVSPSLPVSHSPNRPIPQSPPLRRSPSPGLPLTHSPKSSRINLLGWTLTFELRTLRAATLLKERRREPMNRINFQPDGTPIVPIFHHSITPLLHYPNRELSELSHITHLYNPIYPVMGVVLCLNRY